MKKRFKVTMTLFLSVALFVVGVIPASAKTVHYKGYVTAKLEVAKYRTSKSMVYFSKVIQGYPVYLGHNIIGYGDAGAGTQGISWHEGRWTIEVLSPIDESLLGSKDGIPTAKKIVAYLDKHRLPVPKKYGMIQLYTDSRQSNIQWQKGNHIYHLYSHSSPIDFVKLAVSLNK